MTTRRKRSLFAAFVHAALVGLVACSSNTTGPTTLGTLDPRCTSLCASSDASCSEKVQECESVCQVRTAGMSSACAACLLKNANGGACDGPSPGGTSAACCPDPEFPSTVPDCAAACTGSAGVNPSGDHPICSEICASSEASCSATAANCLQTCDARVHGASGLCALCLLEGANSGACPSGESCCPDPEFPASATDCAAVCAK